MSETSTYPSYSPRTLGQILDCVFRLMRANLKLFVGIAIVPPLAFFLSIGLVIGGFVIPLYAQLPKNASPAQNAQFASVVLPSMMLVFLIYGVVFAPSLAAMAEAAVQADFGIRVTLRDAYAGAFRRFWRYLLLFILVSLLAMSPVIVIQIGTLSIGALVGHGGIATGPAMFVLLPIAILLALACFASSVIIALRLSLAFPACVTENLTAWCALKRSGQLTRGAKGRIFVVLLIVYLVSYLAYLLAMFVAMFVFGIGALILSASHFHAPVAVSMLFGGVLVLAMLGAMSLFMAGSYAGYATALGVIYNDQRIRVDRTTANLPPKMPQESQG